MVDFSLEAHEDPNATCLKFIGEFQGVVVDDFESKIFGYIQNAKNRIEMDLSETPYIDSRAAAFLKTCLAMASKESKRIVLKNPSEQVRKVLSLLHIDKLFQDES